MPRMVVEYRMHIVAISRTYGFGIDLVISVIGPF